MMKEIIAENARRKLKMHGLYNPIKGDGCCGKRVAVTAPDGAVVRVPVEMTRDADYAGAQRDFNAWSVCAAGMTLNSGRHGV